jgi:hypothetical protein
MLSNRLRVVGERVAIHLLVDLLVPNPKRRPCSLIFFRQDTFPEMAGRHIVLTLTWHDRIHAAKDHNIFLPVIDSG